MSRKKKNAPEKTWPTQSARVELAAITVAKRACDWATEVTWTVSYTACVLRENITRKPGVPGEIFARGHFHLIAEGQTSEGDVEII